MDIGINQSGSFDNVEKFLKKMKLFYSLVSKTLDAQGRAGVEALRAATPRGSGLAAQSWSYQVSQNRGGVSITWLNSDVENGFPVAIMLQYGYATGTGGYVQGRDYINPALKPIFDKIADEVWKAVTSS